MNESDVGTYWLGNDGKVWRIILYWAEPTVTWERVDDPEIRCGGAVGSPITWQFTQLVTLEAKEVE